MITFLIRPTVIDSPVKTIMGDQMNRNSKSASSEYKVCGPIEDLLKSKIDIAEDSLQEVRRRLRKFSKSRPTTDKHIKDGANTEKLSCENRIIKPHVKCNLDGRKVS